MGKMARGSFCGQDEEKENFAVASGRNFVGSSESRFSGTSSFLHNVHFGELFQVPKPY
jgi:hypothetical protein